MVNSYNKNKKKSLSPAEEKKRELRNRIGLILFLTFLIGMLWTFDFYNREFKNWNSIDSNLNIFLLININVILLITVSSLLLRNLVKLLYERKKRQLGFRLKSKLTLAFILTSTLPTIVFFFIANGFLTNTLNFWFQGQYAVGLKNSANIVKKFSDHWDEELSHYGNVVAADILKESIPEGKDQEWFFNKLFRYRLDGAIIYNDQKEQKGSWFLEENKSKFWSPISINDWANIDKNTSRLISNSKDYRIYRAVVPLKYQGKPHFLEVVKILPGPWYEELDEASEKLQNYEKLVSLEDPIRTNYETHLILITLLLVFASTWFAFYLARSIVIPIETLVEGTHRIAKGDLDFEIELVSGDEIGMLLGSFNKMTKELMQNRIKLAKSQDEIISANQSLEERNLFVELVLQTIQTGVFAID